jgi:hypothetical protein
MRALFAHGGKGCAEEDPVPERGTTALLGCAWKGICDPHLQEERGRDASGLGSQNGYRCMGLLNTKYGVARLLPARG